MRRIIQRFSVLLSWSKDYRKKNVMKSAEAYVLYIVIVLFVLGCYLALIS